ncbi:MAG: ABC transporter substrate-binding protein, partial [Burkholderiaceae bacterium]
MKLVRALVASAVLSASVVAHAATDLTVTHFGTGMYGVPFAVAKAKGWFKTEANLDVGGFITSKGGGTTVR